MNKRNKSETCLESRHTAFLYSILVGFSVAVVIMLAWYFLDTRERAHINKVTSSISHGIEALITKDIDNQVISLSELARNWELPTRITQIDLELVAQNIYQTRADYLTIGWVDTSLHIRWLLSPDFNKSELNFDLLSNVPPLSVIKTTQNRHTVIFTKPFDSVQGGKGLGIYIPVYRPSPSDSKNDYEFDGFIGSTLLITPLLENLFPIELMAEHEIEISINGQSLSSTNPEHFITNEQWIQHSQFELYNLTWQLNVAPKSESVLNAYSRFSTVMLTLVLLLSSIATFSAYTLLISRRQAYQIRNNRQIMAHLFKNLPGMAYRGINRQDWPMNFVSDGCQSLTGYSKKDFEQQKLLWGTLIHPDDYDYVYKSVKKSIETNTVFEIEYRILTKNNTERWVWERGESFYSEQDNIHRIQGFITDITESKHAEIGLIESSAFSDAVVEAAVEAVITISAKGIISGFNQSAQNMFGYMFDEAMGCHIKILMPESYFEKFQHSISHSLETGDLGNTGLGIETIAIKKEGDFFPIYLLVSEINNHTGRKFVALIRDLSQQQAAENEARQHIEQLAHADRLNMLGEMAVGIAHEINQPLTAISLYAQAGKRLFEKNDHKKLPETFDKLSEHALRAGAVIERMQMMSKRGDRVMEATDSKVLIEEIVKLAETEARIKDIVIKMDIDINLPSVFVDKVQIQQVVLNLLRNGMDSMTSINGKNGNIILLNARLKQDIEVCVIDSGSGVPEEMEDKLFTPFSSTKENGMGMGLSISQAIITEHGGQLNFYNNVTGATFFFTLPVA